MKITVERNHEELTARVFQVFEDVLNFEHCDNGGLAIYTDKKDILFASRAWVMAEVEK